VRTATDENRLTLEELAALGITKATVQEKLLGSFKGWLCEDEGKVVGFAMGDKTLGEMWVIAVLASYTRQGIGSQLLTRVETWLFSMGCPEIWLTTDIDQRLRAYSFYRKHGWEDWKIEKGIRYMKKMPDTSPEPTAIGIRSSAVAGNGCFPRGSALFSPPLKGKSP
jgi:ribosomal protein S18 acetylase RimI-like enzyme